MKSIQTKIIVLIFAGILVATTLVGSLGIHSFSVAIDSEMVKVMNYTCGEKAQELNVIMERIEQSVNIMSNYAIDNLESVEKLSTDAEYLEKYTKDLEQLGLAMVNETEGAVGVYIRFNPEITSPTAGFFKVKKAGDDDFENVEVTDLSMYEPDDRGNVGWYYVPVEAGEPTWMNPYYDGNIEGDMISYIVPTYFEGQLVGIVGMDIDTDYIEGIVDSIQVYETGHAFLTDSELNILHSRHYESGMSVREFSEELAKDDIATITGMENLYDHSLHGEEKKVAFRTLSNGMCLAVTVPVSEINSEKDALLTQMIVIVGVMVIVFISIGWMIAKTIIKPLKELNVAAQEIANGNLNVAFNTQSKDEVGTLAQSLKETAKQLQIRIDYINSLAYIDKLTGVKNNTAYLNEASMIKAELQNGVYHFSLFIIDINGLKEVNDTYGHEYGNELIIAAAKAVSNVFGSEHTYRIGGDEFAVIMKDIDETQAESLKERFLWTIQNNNDEIYLSAAIGYAVYDKVIDQSFDCAFRRADGKMYEIKQEMKKQGQTSAVRK